eukprot:12800152-Heterocapsa_arctica.AAC.1
MRETCGESCACGTSRASASCGPSRGSASRGLGGIGPASSWGSRLREVPCDRRSCHDAGLARGGC